MAGRGRGLCGAARWSERAGDFVKPWVALDGVGQCFMRKLNGAQGDAVALGVSPEPLQGARLAALAVFSDGEPKVVQFAIGFGNHGENGAGGATTGGVFVRSNLADVRKVNDARGRVVVVEVCVVKGAVGDVALVLFDGHEAKDGVGDLLLVELGFAGAVEIAGGLAKFLVDEVIEGFINGNVTRA